MLDLNQDKSLYAHGKIDYCMIKSNLTRKFLEKEQHLMKVIKLLPYTLSEKQKNKFGMTIY